MSLVATSIIGAKIQRLTSRLVAKCSLVAKVTFAQIGLHTFTMCTTILHLVASNDFALSALIASVTNAFRGVFHTNPIVIAVVQLRTFDSLETIGLFEAWIAGARVGRNAFAIGRTFVHLGTLRNGARVAGEKIVTLTQVKAHTSAMSRTKATGFTRRL